MFFIIYQVIFDMAEPSSNLTSKYNPLFSPKPLHSGNIEVLISILSIWEDEHIDMFENNQWKCLWCNVKFQGINATKDLARVIGTKCMLQ